MVTVERSPGRRLTKCEDCPSVVYLSLPAYERVVRIRCEGRREEHVATIAAGQSAREFAIGDHLPGSPRCGPLYRTNEDGTLTRIDSGPSTEGPKT